MSVFLSTAGYQLGNNNPPPFLTGATVYPFTVALWTYVTADPANGMAWSVGSSAQSRDSINLGVVGSVYAVNCDNGAQFQTVSSSLATTLSRWIWIMGRFISTANRWIITLDSRGAITQTQGTTSVPLTGGAFNNILLGGRADLTGQNFSPSRLAEAWYTNTDIGASVGANTALDASMIRNLAYLGPFSVPIVSANVVDYLSLRSDSAAVKSDSTPDRAGRYFSRYDAKFFKYFHTGTTSPGPSSFHPPVASSYVLPPDNRIQLTNKAFMVAPPSSGIAAHWPPFNLRAV